MEPESEGAWMAVARAWRLRRGTSRRPKDALVLPLEGGAGALVRRGDAARLVTTIARNAPPPSSRVIRWLERVQARRSALLVVPDRATGVAVALRWRLDPQRFRVADRLEPPSGRIEDGMHQAAPWHAKG